MFKKITKGNYESALASANAHPNVCPNCTGEMSHHAHKAWGECDACHGERKAVKYSLSPDMKVLADNEPTGWEIQFRLGYYWAQHANGIVIHKSFRSRIAAFNEAVHYEQN